MRVSGCGLPVRFRGCLADLLVRSPRPFERTKSRLHRMFSKRIACWCIPVWLAGCGGFTGIEPVKRVEIREPSGLEIDAVGKGREIRVKVPFEGGLETCGMQKDSFLMDVGTVRCSNNPAVALADLLVAGLRQAGYKVATGDAPSSPATVQIEGELLLLYSEPVGRAGNETDVHVRLTARSLSGLDAERKFYEKGRGGDAQRSVNSAVRRVLQKMVDAVIELMDDYPMLGTPVKATPTPVLKPKPES